MNGVIITLILSFLIHGTSALRPFLYQSSPPTSSTSSSSNGGASYGGSMQYDARTKRLFITGSTFSNGMSSTEEVDSDRGDCFLSILQLSNDEDDNRQTMEVHSTSLGMPDNYEACSAMAFIPSVNTHQHEQQESAAAAAAAAGGQLLLAAHSEEHGILTYLRQPGADKATTYASLLDLDMTTLLLPPPDAQEHAMDWENSLVGGRLFHDSAVQIPTTLHLQYNNLEDDTFLYVGLMSTDNDAPNPLFHSKTTSKTNDPNAAFDDSPSQNNNNNDNTNNPDLTAGGNGGIQPYGTKFGISIKKLRTKSFLNTNSSPQPQSVLLDLKSNQSRDIHKTLEDVWSREYATLDDQTVQLASLLYIPPALDDLDDNDNNGILLMAGTTSGYGIAFAAQTPTTSTDNYHLDGFLTKLDPQTGDLIQESASSNTASSLRIDSDASRDDVILGLCTPPPESLDGGSFVYAVGSTRSFLMDDSPSSSRPARVNEDDDAWHAYLMKVDIHNMSILWVRQIGSTIIDNRSTDVLGHACTVSSDGADVTMTGLVRQGGIVPSEDPLNHPNINHGTDNTDDDDLFVASLDASNGAIYFVRQYGTNQDDAPIRGDGALTTDEEGNILLLGNTNGDSFDINNNKEESSRGPSNWFVLWIERFTGRITTTKTITTEEEEDETISLPTKLPPQPPHTGGTHPSFPDQPTSHQPDHPSDTLPTSTPGLSLLGKVIVVLFWIVTTLCVRETIVKCCIYRRRYLYGRDGDYYGGDDDDDLDTYISECDIHVAITKSAMGGYHGMYSFGSDEDDTSDDDDDDDEWVREQKKKNKEKKRTKKSKKNVRVPDNVTLDTTAQEDWNGSISSSNNISSNTGSSSIPVRTKPKPIDPIQKSKQAMKEKKDRQQQQRRRRQQRSSSSRRLDEQQEPLTSSNKTLSLSSTLPSTHDKERIVREALFMEDFSLENHPSVGGETTTTTSTTSTTTTKQSIALAEALIADVSSSRRASSQRNLLHHIDDTNNDDIEQQGYSSSSQSWRRGGGPKNIRNLVKNKSDNNNSSVGGYQDLVDSYNQSWDDRVSKTMMNDNQT